MISITKKYETRLDGQKKHNVWCESTRQDLINMNLLAMNVTIFSPGMIGV